MSDVKQIVALFKSLDAYEAIELVHLLAECGYQLSVIKNAPNKIYNSPEENLEEDDKYIDYGVFLTEYPDNEKIRTIKLIRSLPDTICKLFNTSAKIDGLKEAKDFVEADRNRPPLGTGSFKNMKKIVHMLNQIEPNLKFIVKEIDF